MEFYLTAFDKVAETWALVKSVNNYEVIVGKMLITEIFRIAPQVFDLCCFKNQYEISDSAVGAGGIPDDLFEDPAFCLHAKSVVLTLEWTVQVMAENDLSTLGERLVTLGAQHVSYGVHPAHYNVVTTALLRTLESALKEHWTPTIRKSWAAVFKLVARCMQAGAGSQLEIMKINRRQRVQEESAALRLQVIGQSEGTSRLVRSRRCKSSTNNENEKVMIDCEKRACLFGDTGPPKIPIRTTDE